MSKKVLIMSASTGGGHNRAARAIKEELESRTIDGISIECEIVDSLKLVNNTMDKLFLEDMKNQQYIHLKHMVVYIDFQKLV